MSANQTQEFLSFALGGLEYGLDVRQVRELCLLDHLERFTDGANVVPGVACRGVIMPLVDLRAAIAAPGRELPQDPHSDVIIVTLPHCAQGRIGMVVDRVNGVVALRADQIRKLPCAGDEAPDYLLGLGSVGARRLILVDIERLMGVKQPQAGCRV